MKKLDRKFFRGALFLNGFAMFVLYPNAMLINEQASWIWDEPARNMAMERMIVAVYMTMGVFLMYSALRPMRNLSFVNFVIVSGFVHATVMLYDAMNLPGEDIHLHPDGDVIGTYIAPVTLLLLHPYVTDRLTGRTDGDSPQSEAMTLSS